MERLVNAVITRLYGRIPDSSLETVKRVLFVVLDDFEVKKKETSLTVTDEIPGELKEYIVSKKIEGLSSTSLKQYTRTLKLFFDTIKKPVQEVTAGDIMLYLYHLEEKSKMSKVSLENNRSIICTFFLWLQDSGHIQKNPGANIKKIKYQKNTRHPLNDLEMEKLRQSCKTLKEKAIVETLYSTGCRVSELVGLSIADIDFIKREAVVLGKGNKVRKVYLNAKALLAITDYIDNRGYKSDYLFCSDKKPHRRVGVRSIEKIISRLGDKANISTNVFPHRIRHTTATDALAHGMRLEYLKDVLGHESTTTTLIYAKIDQSDVKNEYQKCII